MHKSQEELVSNIEQFAELIKIGGVYSHYKKPARRYKVLHFVINEVDDEVYVIYKALYGEQLKFSRSARVWLEQVTYNGRVQNRFTLVD